MAASPSHTRHHTLSSCSFNKKFDRLQTKIDVYMEKAQLIK